MKIVYKYDKLLKIKFYFARIITNLYLWYKPLALDALWVHARAMVPRYLGTGRGPFAHQTTLTEVCAER